MSCFWLVRAEKNSSTAWIFWHSKRKSGKNVVYCPPPLCTEITVSYRESMGEKQQVWQLTMTKYEFWSFETCNKAFPVSLHFLVFSHNNGHLLSVCRRITDTQTRSFGSLEITDHRISVHAAAYVIYTLLSVGNSLYGHVACCRNSIGWNSTFLLE